VKGQKAEGGRQKFLAVLLLPFALCLLTCREKPHYNVLLITLDTFRADRPAPRLDGVTFTNADSPVPLTLPAHSSILSGVLPPQHGLRNNGAGSFPADRETLATVLSKNGYRTGAFVSAFVLDHRFGLNRGFDVYDDEVDLNPEGAATDEAERRGGATVDRALAWLKRGDTRPFFAWVHLYDAHAPYAPPSPYPQTYDGEVAYVDAQVARLLGAIDRSNTIIAIVGDHGEALGEHGEQTHGLLLYEPTLHVPLIVAAPELKPRVVAEPVSTVDLAPTLAALAGVKFGSGNLFDTPSKDLYAETEYPAQFGWSALTSLRRGDVKVIRAPKSEVYDLRKDPKETHNVLDTERRAYRDAVAQLDAIAKTATTAQTAVDEETRRKLASLGYVAPGGGGAASNADPKERIAAFEMFQHATYALGTRHLVDAVRILEPLVRDDPRNAPFREKLAQAYKELGRNDEAIALDREAVALAPQSADAWYNLAAALQDAGNAREASIAIAEAAKRDPRRPEVHNVKGVALIEQGDVAGAEREFRAALDADPRSARAWNNLGNALRAQNRIDEAATAYKKSIELAPLYPDPRNGLGVLLVQSSHAAEALPYFDEALRIAPNFDEAQLNRAIALAEIGDVAAARAQLTALLARAPRGHVNTAARALLARLVR